MASKNTGITRADAIAFAIERCTDAPEVVEVLYKMHKSITKPRAKSGAKTQARIKNERLAAKVRDAISSANLDEGVTTKWVVENVADILTPQKATAVLRVACELGYVHKNTVGKSTFYTLV